MRYKVILCDPPWSYQDKASAGKRGAGFKYPTMALADLQKLPVAEIADDDCALFMWVTGPQLTAGIALMSAWEFIFKTIAFTWVKKTKHGKMHWGMGNWTRANPEYVLLGVTGKPKRADNKAARSVHSVVQDTIGAHSVKPSSVNEKIVQLMGDVPRLELFARTAREGWDVAGLDINGMDMKEALLSLANPLKTS